MDIKNESKVNLTVEDLKEAIKDLPDDMPIIIPVITEEDANLILAFRHVRTIGILNDLYLSDKDPDKLALCLNASADGVDISTQIENNKLDVACEKIIY